MSNEIVDGLFKEQETPASKGMDIVLEVLKEHGLEDIEVRKVVFDMQKRGVLIIFSPDMLDIVREIG